jgi:uncharacterized Zn-binding protein involved in type VI secretion
MHSCPLMTGPVPHLGGPLLQPGCPTVLIGFQPAARATDLAVCVGPPDVITQGSVTVLIGHLPAARLGDLTAHGGAIAQGFPTVLIGGTGAEPPPPKVVGGLEGMIDIIVGILGEQAFEMFLRIVYDLMAGKIPKPFRRYPRADKPANGGTPP